MIHHQHSVDGQKEELKQKTEINEKLEVISNFDMPMSINIIIPCMIYIISYILCSHLFLKVRHTQMIKVIMEGNTKNYGFTKITDRALAGMV